MKTKHLFYFLLTCLAATRNVLYAQADIHFSQFYETTILRNPGLMGVSAENFKVSGYYRNQWASIANPYQTALIDGEYRFPLGSMSRDFITFGVLGFADQAGDLDQKITGIYPSLCLNKFIDENNNAYLSFGVTCGYLQYSFDPSKATFNNQFQGGVFSPYNATFENIPAPKMTLMDLGAGLNFNFSPNDQNEGSYILGVSGYHFSQPVFSYYRSGNITNNIRWNVNADMVHNISQTIVFQLHANWAQQGTYNESMFGGLLGWQKPESYSSHTDFEIYAGALYRMNDAIIPVFKMKVQGFGIGVSYDVNTSSLKEASQRQGGLEITLSISAHVPKNSGYKKTVCPRFF